MVRSIRWFLLALSLSFVIGAFAACSDDDGPTAPGPEPGSSLTGTIGPTGGTLQSPDGNLTLTVPAGALASDTTISITEELSAARARDRSPTGVFLTEPAGLAFAEPVTMRLEAVLERLPATTMPGSVPLIRGMGRDAVEGISILDGIQWLDERAGTHTIEVQIEAFPNTIEFSRDWNGRDIATLVRPMYASPTMQNSDFAGNPTIEVSAGLGFGNTVRFFHRDYSGATAITADGATLTPVSLGTGTAGQSIWEVPLEFRSGSTSEASLSLGLGYTVTPDGPTIWPDPSERPIRMGTTTIFHDPPTTTIQLDPDLGPDDGWLATGLYDVDPGDESAVAVPPMVTWQLGGSLSITSRLGTRFLSLAKDTPLALLNDDMTYPVGSYWGGLPVGTGSPDYVENSIYFFQFGQAGGELIRWDAAGDFFGGGIVAESGASVTHASAWDGGLAYTTELSGKVDFLSFDTMGGFQKFATISSYPGGTSNPVAAAKPAGDPGAVIVLGGMPGSIWYHDLVNPGAGATKLGDAGDTPRDLEFAGGLGFVSNRGSGTVSIIKTTPSLSVSGTYAVGSEPLGLAARTFASGNIGVITANWGDNSYSVAELTPDGVVVDVMTNALPGAASGAVDAFWLPGETAKYGVLASTSGHLLIGDSGIE